MPDAALEPGWKAAFTPLSWPTGGNILWALSPVDHLAGIRRNEKIAGVALLAVFRRCLILDSG
jgi:hypothetical protein